jgi:hypothetical protein
MLSPDRNRHAVTAQNAENISSPNNADVAARASSAPDAHAKESVQIRARDIVD